MVTITARGASGAVYSYALSKIGDSWLKVPLNYMFGRAGQNGWIICYIGETENAAGRFRPHERWEEAVRMYGATHVLNHVASAEEDVRQREERDLILSHNPPMNVQHRPVLPTIRRGLGAAPSPAQSALARALLRRKL